MIRALIEQTFDATKKYYVMCGLSTDTKPTSGLITGSQFHEVDTGTKYKFDEVNSLWHVVGITEQEIKDEIDAWLEDHPEATTTVEDGAISYAKLNSSLQGTVDDVGTLNTEIQNKANVDGSYSSLTAGNAEQLVSTVGVNDKTPYLFRTTGGSADVGDRVKLSKITGGTVAWNQLVNTGDTSVTVPNGHKYYSRINSVQTIGASTGSAISINDASEDNVFDLTAMFGSTIADYLYTLESGTAGAGVAKLKSWGFCTAEYYAYDTGSLLSVKTTAHKTYDEENTLIGNYPLDDVELRGIPKLDANNNLYYSGDSYTPDGTVTRRFAIVNLGEKTWTEVSMSSGKKGYTIPFGDLAGTPAGLVTDTWCDSLVSNGLYSQIRQSASTWPAGSYVFSQGGGTFGAQKFGFVTDGSFADAAAFKASMSGVYLVYELATATTESADPYQERQICANDGTEEFVDSRTVPMPVGYNAFYQANLRAKLEMAPDSPAGDGDYIVRQTDGLNEYVLLEKELPTLPSTDGTYSLKCTVASGTATLSWVADA